MSIIGSYVEDVMYNAGMSAYRGDEPPMTFTGKRGQIICQGEGGNRYIYVGDHNGFVRVYVDLHVYGGEYAAMVTVESCSGKMDAWRVIEIMHAVQYHADSIDRCCFWYKKDSLDKLFERLYRSILSY